MKRALLAFALAASFALPGAAPWKKYIASADFSFHYPEGWKVEEQDSVVTVSNPKTQEELLLLAIPFDKRKSPLDLARDMVDLFKQKAPDIQAFGFRESNGNSVYFQWTYSDNRVPFRSEILVVKDASSAHWFSYSAPKNGYNQAYGLGLLQTVVGSIASGSGSKPPAATQETASLDKNARSFLFVLEFALGAPFNHAQERLILDELLGSWRTQDPASLKQYDLYPTLVTTILDGGQHDLEKLRKELEGSIREWLETSDPQDRVVRLVRTQLDAKSKVVAAGKPPLTEAAATAYAELMTFAELLSANRGASPSQIAPADVDILRQRLKSRWGSLSGTEKEDVLSTPGLWITFRTLLQFGGGVEKEKVRSQLAKLAPSTPQSGQSPSRPMTMVEHNVLMNINQMTFNSYMWSRGFKSTMLGY